MAQSAFAFYRGAAKLMALDLSATPRTGIDAQICGDAHLSNFGVYASPERALIFDVNDFDETLSGPWEWDVKRLAASFAIAARHNELSGKAERSLARASVAAYSKAMARFAEMRYADLWYSHIRIEDLFAAFGDQLSKKRRRRGEEFVAKARRKGSLHARDKLAEEVDGEYRIASDPPLLIPIRDFPAWADPAELRAGAEDAIEAYTSTVPEDLLPLLSRYRLKDIALKVVGVGSVGTRCSIALFEGRDHDDPLFLQVKEATRSVLEDQLPKSRFRHAGKRVVVGQKIMQANNDIFLGWTSSTRTGAHYYVRQLKDMKGSVDVEGADAEYLGRYAQLCGWTLAHAHARSADPAAISGYLGKKSTFDQAVAEFATIYAAQNESDYQAFRTAIADGRIKAHE